MDGNIYLIISILVLLVIVLLGMIYYKKCPRGGCKTNYRKMYELGIIFTPVGIVMMVTTDSYLFFILGLVYLGIGLVNKDKWENEKPPTAKERRIMVYLLGSGTLLLVIGVIVFFLVK